MTEYNLGDRVMYRGVEGVITRRINELYEVRLEDSGHWLHADQMEPLKTAKGCMYCKHGEPLNDASNSDFALTISYDENDYHVYVEFANEVWWGDDYATINYCPMCGRKLEVAE